MLELGCGAGANIPLFMALGMDYYAIEGSPTIVKQLHDRYPSLAGNIACGDFTAIQPFPGQFDLVIDRSALTHNSTRAIIRGLNVAFDSLKPGGVFIGSDWFSINHSNARDGSSSEDAYTRTDYSTGQFAGVGQVHFSDEAHLRTLFSQFEIIFMEEKQSRRFEPKDAHLFAAWNIVAKKPNV